MSDKIRQRIVEVLLESLSAVRGVVSTTLVGSLVDQDDFSSISDIDTVVVCEKLDKTIYNQCLSAVMALDGKQLGLPGYSVRVNPTFGPLKLDTAGQVIVHLMVYDLAGHRRHVIKSPFTCLDWERSGVFHGKPLASVCPVLGLQPRDFVEARRGLRNYIDDLENERISYRRYEFSGADVCEVVDSSSLNRRQQGEYAYHIIRNLVANCCKLLNQENRLYSQEELLFQWKRWLPQCASFIPSFKTISTVKHQRVDIFPPDTLETVRNFIEAFHKEFNLLWELCPRVLFVRHGKTRLNDGSFLGRSRDPGLSPQEKILPLEETPSLVLTSPALRAQETACRLAPTLSPTSDLRLQEIDCGDAEGLQVAQLKERYPEVWSGWVRGEDPHFPNGENSAAVLERLQCFLGSLIKEHFSGQKSGQGPILVVTHNVVLRCMLGSAWKIPMSQWHKIQIPYQVPIEFSIKDGIAFPNLPRDLISEVIGSFGHRTA